MAAPSESRVIFVGNIPYDVTEEELIEIFSSVGNVVGFRLVFERETGKPKGYGFCEFEDPETAASAVRNLSDYQIKGRPLRLNAADGDPSFLGRSTHMGQLDRQGGNRGGFSGGPRGGGHAGGAWDGGHNNFQQQPPNFSKLPEGPLPPPGMKASDSIEQTLASLPPEQLLSVMNQVKTLVGTSPEAARTLLSDQPQLAYALFQAMLMMNIVDPAILQRVLSASEGGPPPPAGPAQPHGYGYFNPGPPGAGAVGTPPLAGASLPPGPKAQAPYGQPPHMMQQQQPLPQHQQGYPGPPQFQASQPMPQNPAGGGDYTPEQQQQLLMQVLSLPQEQIDALPPSQRASIMQLKAQMGR